MRVCLAGKEKIGDFAYKEDCDLIVFSFRGLSSVVSYEKEIGGETNYMEEIAVLSKGKKIVVCGGETDTLGVKRKSVIVAQNGKILGICDMLHSTKERDSAGTGMGIFDTELGRVGVIVGEDLYFPEDITEAQSYNIEKPCCTLLDSVVKSILSSRFKSALDIHP